MLEAILANKRAEIALMGPAPPVSRAPVEVRNALRSPGRLSLIAEIKKRSPSAGELSTVMSTSERALAYARAGASMVSVLCDSKFFGGSWEDLASARVAAVPLLAKEFILEEIQLDHARGHGADAVLLIARIVPDDRLAALVAAALERGLEPLVEVATPGELEVALQAGARVVGVNARDLDTLAIDRERARAVLGRIPREVVSVHFSGLKTGADVAQIAQSGVDAALVGEALMRRDDPAPLLSELVARASMVK
jgi:indole-3-glycerol phosphate synthase